MNKLLKKMIFVGAMLSLGAVVRPASWEDMCTTNMEKNKDALFTHVCALARVNGEMAGLTQGGESESNNLDPVLTHLRDSQQQQRDAISGLLNVDIALFNEIAVPRLQAFFGDVLRQEGLPGNLSVAGDKLVEYCYEPVTFGDTYLPNAMIDRIASCADTQTFGRLAQACRHLHEVADSVPVAEKVQRLLEKNDPDAVQILDAVIESKPGTAELRALKDAVENNLMWAIKPLLEMGLASCGEYKPGFATETSRYDSDQERQSIQRNALEWAVRANNEAVGRLLVEECGVDVNQFFTTTLLREMAWFGKADQVRLLLELGADPNICGLEKMSPLGAAVERNSSDIFEKVKLLCEYGATVLPAQGCNNKSVLMVASENGRVEVVRILVSKLRDELGVLGLEEKISIEVKGWGNTYEVQCGRERFGQLLDGALEAARFAGHDEVVVVLERALEEGLPEPAGPAPKQDKE